MLLPMPLYFVYLWRKKQFPVNSFFSGAAVFVVFYLVLRYYVISTLPETGLLSLLFSALIVETGRWAGFLLLPYKEGRDNGSMKTGLSLALGYITAAFLLINAFAMAMNFIYALSLGGWDKGADYLSRFPSESVDRIQALIVYTPSYTYLLETLSLYLAIPVQIVLTLLIFEAYRSNRSAVVRGMLYGGALLVDFLYFSLGSVLSESSGWAGHLLFLALSGGAALYILIRFWKGELRDTFSAS